MANEVDPALSSSLSAPASDVPAQQRSADSQSQQPQQPQAQTPQEPKEPAPTTSQPKEKQIPSTDGAADTPEKLTPAELKKRAKAEKAARRAREKVEREQAGGGGPSGGGAGAPAPGTPAKKGQSGKDAGNVAPAKGQRGVPRRGSSQAGQAAVPEQKKKEDKSVAVFGHLYGQQRRTTVAGAGKEVHPAVLALGLQMRDYVICGSSARCVATLLAFKRVGFIAFFFFIVDDCCDDADCWFR